jgi:hypothetical protein
VGAKLGGRLEHDPTGRPCRRGRRQAFIDGVRDLVGLPQCDQRPDFIGFDGQVIAKLFLSFVDLFELPVILAEHVISLGQILDEPMPGG